MPIMESIQFFLARFRAPRDLSIAGKTQENKSFYVPGEPKKQKNLFLPPFHSWVYVSSERVCPKEPKSEVLARSKQYFDHPFQFYEMAMHGWISLVVWYGSVPWF